MPGRTIVSIATGAALFSLVVPAWASRANLEWIAPEGCSSKEQVLAAVDHAAGSGGDGERTISARAEVEAASQGWRVRLTTSTAERTLEADTCQELSDAVALILALALDRSQGRGPNTEAVLPTTSSLTLEAPTTPVPRRRPSLVAIGAGEVADVGTLPTATIGGKILVGLRLPPIRFEVAGAAWATQRAIVDGTTSADFSMLSANGNVCFLPTLHRFEVGGCAGGGVDSMTATSFGAIATSQGWGAWSTVSAEGRAAWQILPWLAAHASLGVQMPLARPTFVIDALGPVHRPSAISGRQSFGLELRFL